MTCEEVRVALSARLDGEDPGVPPEAVDGHVDSCPSCGDWAARARHATRTAVLAPADVPDLTVPILAAAAAAAAAERRRFTANSQVLRVAVAVLAVAQLLAALPVLFGGAHAGREMASFDVALAVGFALVALRPERAQALVPVAFVLAVCLAATSAFDIVSGRTEIVHEVGHLASVVQAMALWALGRSSREIPVTPVPPAVVAGRG